MNVWNKQKECDDDIKQIQNSGWKHKFMIVGGSVGFSDSNGVSLGKLEVLMIKVAFMICQVQFSN